MDIAVDIEEEPEDELPPLVGKVIEGRYRVEMGLSAGGMGAVFVATHIELERRVALKVMLGQMTRNQEAVRRFQREARTASQIGHPNIVDIHDLGRLEDGSPYLVMELLEGKSLADDLEERASYPLDEVIALLEPVANALDTVHKLGIVHRDIKPENIFLARMINGSTVIKLLDFGLAAFQESDGKERLTAAGTMLGTPHYMPPEAVEGASKIDASGDVYALASVAFELLTGVLPYEYNDSVRELIVNKVTKPAPTMSERCGTEVPKVLEEAVAKGIAKEPADRYADAGSFIAALRRASEAHPGWRLPAEARRPDTLSSGEKKQLAGRATFIEGKGVEGSAGGPGKASLRVPYRRPLLVPALLGLVVLLGAGVGLWAALGSSSSGAEAAESVTDPGDRAPGGEAGPPAIDPASAGSPAAAGPATEGAEAEGGSPEAEGTEAGPGAAEAGASGTPSPRPQGRAGATSRSSANQGGSSAAEGSQGTQEAATGTPSEAANQAASQAASQATSQATNQAASQATSQAGGREEGEAEGSGRGGRERAEALAQEAGRALIRGELPSAQRLYREATYHDPRFAPAWRGLGLANEQMGRAPEAVRAYERYLRLSPGASDAAAIRRRLERLSG